MADNPSTSIIGPEILPTIELQVISLIIAFAISIPIAVHSARKPVFQSKTSQ